MLKRNRMFFLHLLAKLQVKISRLTLMEGILSSQTLLICLIKICIKEHKSRTHLSKRNIVRRLCPKFLELIHMFQGQKHLKRVCTKSIKKDLEGWAFLKQDKSLTQRIIELIFPPSVTRHVREKSWRKLMRIKITNKSLLLMKKSLKCLNLTGSMKT